MDGPLVSIVFFLKMSLSLMTKDWFDWFAILFHFTSLYPKKATVLILNFPLFLFTSRFTLLFQNIILIGTQNKNIFSNMMLKHKSTQVD